MSPLWNPLPESAIIQDVSTGLPADRGDTPACGTAMQTAQPLARCTAHVQRRFVKRYYSRFPMRKMWMQKRAPKPHRIDAEYFDYHTRGEIL